VGCVTIGNSKVLLASVYKFPGRARSNADITEFLSFRRKSDWAVDMNAKHLFWNNAVSNTSASDQWPYWNSANSKFKHHNALLLEMVTC
jgi:Tfp pilus assembly protein PilN